MCLCVRLRAGNKSIIGIAFHSSITFLSCRIPWSARMCIMSARRVFDWGVRSLSAVAEFWREVCVICLAALALLDSVCL